MDLSGNIRIGVYPVLRHQSSACPKNPENDSCGGTEEPGVMVPGEINRQSGKY